MCGIAGIYGSHLPREEDRRIRAMLQAIRHRGPDEAGIYLSPRLCMGTVRLSIVGIETGQQPIFSDDGRHFLCYNGEVYNYIELREELQALGHKFSTTSDTEVVLHAWRAWGEKCLTRFNGAFALAVYDKFDDTLYLARDKFGKRPLFYAANGKGLLFASEMKSFLALDDFKFEFDPRQLASILTLWTPIADQSAYKGVHQVPQGSYVIVTQSDIVVRRYHQQDFQARETIQSESEALDAIRSELRKAVDLRLRGDVEVGMYLSGGLDSSILASVLSDRVGKDFKTYSVAFEDKEFDESSDQQRVAQHVGSKHQTLLITESMLAENFPEVAFHAEVPLFRTAPVPMFLLSRMVHDDGIKVVLTGEGADEAFLGYDVFKETLLRSAWNDIDDSEKIDRLRQLYPYLKHYATANATDLLGLYQQYSKERYSGLFSHELRIQNGLFAKRLLNGQVTGELDAIQQLLGEHGYFPGLSAVEKAQWLEYQTLLPGYLLSSQGDRMALAHGLENRTPFLDPHVVDLASAVNLKFDDGTDEKYLLRKAFADRLPAENIRKRKHPYRAPDSKAFINSAPDYLELLLSDGELGKNEFLNQKFCRLLIDKVSKSSAQEISIKENQAFVFLVSICLQSHQFVRRNSLPVAKNAPIDDILKRIVDHRHH